ncbi:hypothetical protein Z517_00800 [Fonsecaea pedrosoi CBS 271.37]|uniref:Uncharacterized protein n=1 Tax=Fonsecaea pedrosoi CBS 271.37 TaxID=1442368 RepID=A0A0D2H3H0_9EURO|nr:uncharacterized protein Z517_00800 [Fonsecaea pedrosoi CBS 271.37]KIW85410.1 hypothetical protein Z517_00800 [Fonsecaea pedrosoi CBS 271.37]
MGIPDQIVVLLVIIGAAAFVTMGFAFQRLFGGQDPNEGKFNVKLPEQEAYMREAFTSPSSRDIKPPPGRYKITRAGPFRYFFEAFQQREAGTLETRIKKWDLWDNNEQLPQVHTIFQIDGHPSAAARFADAEHLDDSCQVISKPRKIDRHREGTSQNTDNNGNEQVKETCSVSEHPYTLSEIPSDLVEECVHGIERKWVHGER